LTPDIFQVQLQYKQLSFPDFFNSRIIVLIKTGRRHYDTNDTISNLDFVISDKPERDGILITIPSFASAGRISPFWALPCWESPVLVSAISWAIALLPSSGEDL
jgi:hypothetical protein